MAAFLGEILAPMLGDLLEGSEGLPFAEKVFKVGGKFLGKHGGSLLNTAVSAGSMIIPQLLMTRQMNKQSAQLGGVLSNSLSGMQTEQALSSYMPTTPSNQFHLDNMTC